MRHSVFPFAAPFARIALAALAVLMLAVTLLHAAPQRAAAAEGELLPNASFSEGTEGWGTNGKTQKLTVLSGGIAELTTTARGNAVLNDRPNAVQNTVRGTDFTVTAEVRTTTPDVSGILRIREVANSNVHSSSQWFQLKGTEWTTVTLQATTRFADSQLDFNLQASQLRVGENLQVRQVSVKETPEVPVTPEPPTTPAPTDPEPTEPAPTDPEPNEPAPTEPEPTEPVDECQAPAPTGTLYGSSLSTRGQTLIQAVSGVDALFGRADVVRHFSPGMPLDWQSKNAQLLSDRTLITSFKVAPAEIVSGKHDAFFKNWFATAPSDQTIYWSYFHEPEDNINKGEFTEAQYRAAWKHLAEIEQAACQPNMHATLILTEWTMNPNSKRDYRVYDAGHEYVKVLAFDPYNGIYDTDRDFYESPESLLGPIAEKMEADGRPWGIAEIGSRLVIGDPNGAGRAKWFADIGRYTAENDLLFVTYFHDIGPNGDYRLQDKASIDAWAKLV